MAPAATYDSASRTVMATAGARMGLAPVTRASTVTTVHSVSLELKPVTRHLDSINAFLVLSDGCPNNCHNHGNCQLFRHGWRCSCLDGWKGDACNVAVESHCGNNIDDDGGEVCH